MRHPALNTCVLLTALAMIAAILLADDAPTQTAPPEAVKAHKLKSVSIRKMADSLHAVIAADSQAYVDLGALRAANGGGAPTHAQQLRQAATSIQQRGAEFSYVLRAASPIDPQNGPQTQVEQQGLAAVLADPGQPFYTEEELGGRSYFTAIYADRATGQSCVDCHNAEPRSPRQDIKIGDVMGGIVVRVPLEF
jgi:hypothetical protein